MCEELLRCLPNVPVGQKFAKAAGGAHDLYVGSVRVRERAVGVQHGLVQEGVFRDRRILELGRAMAVGPAQADHDQQKNDHA